MNRTTDIFMYMAFGSILTLIILYMNGHIKMIEKYSPERFEMELRSIIDDMEEDGLIIPGDDDDDDDESEEI